MKSSIKEENEKILGIIQKDTQVIESLMNEMQVSIRWYVKKRGGTIQDAEDLMQDTMTSLFKMCKDEDVILNKTVEDYFFGIAKRIWHNHYKRNVKKAFRNEEYAEVFKETKNIDNYILENIHRNNRLKVYKNYLNRLNTNCKEIFEMLNSGFSLEEISIKLDYTMNFMYKKHWRCKKELFEKIKSDPNYNELKFDNN